MLKISDGAKEAIKILTENGYEAYVVGGSVRDMLLGKEASDFDIATSATPDEMKRIFKGKSLIETGIKHGTLTFIHNKESIEITAYRIEGEYKDNRHPESVEFTRDIHHDLSRRDFTINALAYNENEGIIDLFGGRSDIENKIIRAIGEPEKRFKEDALRILRAIRFSSTLGFTIEKDTRKAMEKCVHLLDNISGERINAELSKFLLGKNVKNAIIENYKILGKLISELLQMKDFDQHSKWHIYDALEHTAHTVESIEPIPHLRLTMLLHDIGKVHTFTLDKNGEGHFYGHNSVSAEIAKEFLNKYKYDTFTRERVYNLIKIHDTPLDTNRVFIKKRLNRLGEEMFFDLLKVQLADNLSHAPALERSAHIRKIEEVAREIINEECFSLKSLEISGTDLISLGFESGKKLGDTLACLLNEVLEERLPNKKEALVKRALEIK